MEHFIKSIFAFALIFSACAVTPQKSKNVADDPAPLFAAGPPVVIYKTKSDYHDKVPITLSDDGQMVINYPHPKDVFYQGVLAYPTLLSSGYLLDNRGINQNSVFVGISYEEYSKFASPPNLKELEKLILDKDPFIEMYYCGERSNFPNGISDINKVIETGNFDRWQKLK